MTVGIVDGRRVPELSQETWASLPGSAYLEDIDPLAIDKARYKYVGQGGILAFNAGDFQSVGSEGFSSCSGLVVKEKQTGIYTFSHLEPLGHKFFDYLMERQADPWKPKKPKQIGPASAVFVYGSHSNPQFEIDRLMSESYWGDIDVRTIHLDTGNTHFHTSFNPSKGILSVIRKKPEQTIHNYQVFEPAES